MSSRDISERPFDQQDGKTVQADTCPECSGDLVTDGGEISCTECGLIVNQYRFDHAASPFLFDGTEDDRKRTGAPLTPARHDRGLSSEIGYGQDAKGNTIDEPKRRQLGRLRREHNRARWESKVERNLAHGCTEIARITGALDLPSNVREEACMFFRKAQHENLLLGRSIEAIAAASVHAACRCDGYLRSIDELTEITPCARSDVLNAYRVLNVELEVEAKPPRPQDFIPRIAAECNVSDIVRERALDLASIAEESRVANGRNPAGVAAGCLYMAGREREIGPTQAELAEIAGVTEVTIRERYYELKDESSELPWGDRAEH